MHTVIKLAVRELVEFVLRSGSIDSRFTGSDRAAEGSRIHRRLQKQAPCGYEAEVALRAERRLNDIVYILDGRADGIFTEDGAVILDEIKTTNAPTEQLTASFSAVHWAQGECYAAMYCEAQALSAITVQLTYYQIDTQELIRHRRSYTVEQLEGKMREYLLLYEPFAILSASHSGARAASLAELRFPFSSYRKGQYELARAVYLTISRHERLAAIAPTGIGKTMSTIFPAVKAMGEGKIDSIFYLTAKTITRKAACDAIAVLKQSHSLALYTLVLTAKDKICPMAERECTPLACPYAKGYYTRINAALLELLAQYSDFTAESLTQYARQYELCPFELALDLSLFCDIIVCDYNYLFDPVVRLQRFFAKENGDYAFLIDEAHNLGDRARSMYSAQLNKAQFYEVKKALGKGSRKLGSALRAINSYFVALRDKCADTHYSITAEGDDKLATLIAEFVAQCAKWLDDNKQHALHKQLLELYFAARFYLRIYEVYDEHYVTKYSAYGACADVTLMCLDASAFIDASLKYGKAAILFSATLYPTDYYQKTLGLGECKKIILPSPFNSENLCLISCVDISTKYNDRADTLDEICELVHTAVGAKKGNYIAYLPSYKYMEAVSTRYTQLYPMAKLLLQQSAMGEDERDSFLAAFGAENDVALLGFCVLGGIFAEGIDLAGDRLIGSIIVGVGLPQLSYEQNVLKDYYEQTYKDGFAYAYQYPGFTKVLQAAGRVIRTESDKGLVLLIDSRYSTARYKALYPTHWQGCIQVHSVGELSSILHDFWDDE